MDHTLSTIVVIFISLFTIIYAYFKYAFGYWKSKRIAYDEPSFPFGNIKGVGIKYHVGERIKQIYDKFKTSSSRSVKVVGTYLFATPVAMVLDLELVKSILIKDFAQFDDRDMYYNETDDPLSGHLIRVDGEKWRKLRRKLTPLFSSGNMKFIFPTIVEIGERLRACLHDAAVAVQHNDSDDDGGLEIRDWFSRFVIDIIGTCTLGIECNTLNDSNAKFRQIACRTGLNARRGPLVFAILTSFKKIARKFHIKSIYDDVTEFIIKVTNDTIEYRRQNNLQQNDFLELMMRIKDIDDKEKSLTFNEIAGQVYLFFAAGHDSTTIALTFTLYQVAKHPEVQAKARDIIETVFEKYNGQLTYEMMSDLPYIDQIVEESLRMYPTPFTVRKAKSAYAIPGTDIVLDKGTRLVIPIHAIHHDPEYYPNPEQFDPDRFEDNVKNNRNSMAWLAFGSGPRICIGQRFAMLQAKVCLIILLKNFQFSVGSKTIEPIPINVNSLLLAPKHGVYLKVKPLNG